MQSVILESIYIRACVKCGLLYKFYIHGYIKQEIKHDSSVFCERKDFGNFDQEYIYQFTMYFYPIYRSNRNK